MILTLAAGWCDLLKTQVSCFVRKGHGFYSLNESFHMSLFKNG